MPSRQERRQAKRDAAKRAPRTGAVGAAGATAALANLHVNSGGGGDWRTQAEDPWVLVRALPAEIVKQRASKGDRQGLTLVHFSAQPELFLIRKTHREHLPTPPDNSATPPQHPRKQPETTPKHPLNAPPLPQHVLTLS